MRSFTCGACCEGRQQALAQIQSKIQEATRVGTGWHKPRILCQQVGAQQGPQQPNVGLKNIHSDVHIKCELQPCLKKDYTQALDASRKVERTGNSAEGRHKHKEEVHMELRAHW